MYRYAFGTSTTTKSGSVVSVQSNNVRRANMNWIKDLLWDKSLSVRDNLATWALGIIGFSMFYVLLFLVLLLGEAQ
jgi:hypothetical protein